MTNRSEKSPEQKFLSTLGLCVRAGKVIIGTPMVCEAMRQNGTVVCVTEASDTSENTHKKLTDKCTYYRIPLYRLTVTGETLGHAVGKTGIVAAVAITDAGFYKALEKYLES